MLWAIGAHPGSRQSIGETTSGQRGTAAAAAASDASTRSVEGRVRRPSRVGADSNGTVAAAGAMVTLHRVGKDTAGPIDSVRTDADGRYRFRYRPFGARDAVYFASVTWGGIAYFTAPLRTEKVSGDDAEITVFDTTSHTFPLSVKGRHLIVGKVDSASMRTIIEVFELSNDSLRTLTSPDGKNPSPTWSVDIPQAALDVRVTQGEIAPEAFSYAAGRVSVFAPIAPGLKQIAFSYKLPASAFPVAIKTAVGAMVFEVLLEEAEGTLTAPGFTSVQPVTVESRHFRRFLAQDVKPNTSVIVELPASRASGRTLYSLGLLVAIGVVVLLLVMRALQRRASRTNTDAATVPSLHAMHATRSPEGERARDGTPKSARGASMPLHERLAQEIAALDAVYARTDSPSESVRAAYDARRLELKAALAEALASVRTAQ